MVVWIIGLSGAGKTTLAREVVALIRRQVTNVVLLDGDIIRDVFGGDLGYSMEDRKKNADRSCNLCKFLEDQGIHVVCAILSLFPESRAWNRENLMKYHEVFIDAPVDDLVARDAKGIYGRFNRGEIRDVAGLDIEFAVPEAPDLIIRNSGPQADLLSHAAIIANIALKK